MNADRRVHAVVVTRTGDRKRTHELSGLKPDQNVPTTMAG